MEFDFKVGRKEKHTVSFNMNRLLVVYTIKVDGKQTKQSFFFFGGNHVVNFEVGEKERHKIQILVHMPMPFPAFKEWSYKVFIDGKKEHAY